MQRAGGRGKMESVDCLNCPFFAACRATQESVMCTLFCPDLMFGRSNSTLFSFRIPLNFEALPPARPVSA